MRKTRNVFRALGLVQDIVGRDDGKETLYLRRFFLTPRWKWQLLLHVFYRGDEDPDPHDHPWDFWTFPLGRHGYVEEEMSSYGYSLLFHVPGRRWTFRPSSHIHRVVGPVDPTSEMPSVGRDLFPMATLILRTRAHGTWGFWVRDDNKAMEQACGRYWDGNPRRGRRVWVPWRTYIYGRPQDRRREDYAPEQ